MIRQKGTSDKKSRRTPNKNRIGHKAEHGKENQLNDTYNIYYSPPRV
jgi:hypothetical protein